MASLETTPTPIANTKPRFVSRKFLLLFVLAGVLLAATASVMLLRTGAHPLERRLLGVWELKSTPSGASEERLIMFRDDGHFWIYPKGKRYVTSEMYDWRVADGDLVVVFDNPFSAKNAPTSARLTEMVRRVADPFNSARSYRYAVKDKGGETITISLAEERGNAPARAEWATLTRAAEQPPP